LNIFTSFQSLVSDEIIAVENLMRQQAEGFNEDLKAALDHLILSGGKRLRPNITLLVGKMLNDLVRWKTATSKYNFIGWKNAQW